MRGWGAATVVADNERSVHRPTGGARLTVLAATGHSEIGDQIRGTGGCHTGAEKAVEFSEDTDLEVLTAGLQQLAKLGDDPA